MSNLPVHSGGTHPISPTYMDGGFRAGRRGKVSPMDWAEMGVRAKALGLVGQVEQLAGHPLFCVFTHEVDGTLTCTGIGPLGLAWVTSDPTIKGGSRRSEAARSRWHSVVGVSPKPAATGPRRLVSSPAAPGLPIFSRLDDELANAVGFHPPAIQSFLAEPWAESPVEGHWAWLQYQDGNALRFVTFVRLGSPDGTTAFAYGSKSLDRAQWQHLPEDQWWATLDDQLIRSRATWCVPFRLAAGDSPYDILGVEADATYKEIKAAYRRAVKRTHPDGMQPLDFDRTGRSVHGQPGGVDSRAFFRVQEAFEQVRSLEGRRAYDERRRTVPVPTSVGSLGWWCQS